MAKLGPIIIAEDDPDDQEILRDILQELHVQNELKFFDNGQKVLEYLLQTIDHPFMILSDVNLLGMSGYDLKASINTHHVLSKRSIPFIFLTTSVEPNVLRRTYEMKAQGYFQKGDSMDQMLNMLNVIIQYWTLCKYPTNE
ncbi:MAG TPA: response regulator [Flavisolibacter sp.]|nr:response regulator [Flavisolibacter sp.]